MTSLDIVHLLLLLVILACYLIASYTDVREFKIPNWISLTMIGAYVIKTIVTPDVIWSEVGTDVGIAFIVLMVGFALYAVGAFGAGDVKLLAAGTLWAGTQYALSFVLGAMLAGGLVALSIIVGLTVRDRMPMIKGMGWLDSYRTYMPYGLGIMVAGILVLWQQAHLWGVLK